MLQPLFLKTCFSVVILFACRSFLGNALAVEVISHRGVHQALRTDQPIGNFQCTADRIEGASHDFIENTIPSIQAAFDAGADRVEIDIHLTADGDIAVFHDFDLKCRTDAALHNCQLSKWRDAEYCLVEKHDMAFIKKLDAGYNYTTDGGKTFPLRGKGVGLIPSLREVLEAFPGKALLLDYKGDEGDTLAAVERIIKAYPGDVKISWYLLSPKDEARVLAIFPRSEILFRDKSFYKSCYLWLLGTSWFGYVPDKCLGVSYGMPLSIFRKAGWFGHAIINRVHSIGSRFILALPETLQDAKYADDFAIDGVFTNHVEIIGPYYRDRGP